jgi:outer membrane protein TolC
MALRNYPAVRAARERIEVAGAGVDLADTAYLPRVDLLWQELRATRNNISGTLFPQAVIPAISGPVNKDRSWDSRWGSAGGVLFSWEPVDFGLRAANVELARVAVRQAEADHRVTRLEVAAAAADAFVVAVAAEQTLRAAQANVERWDVFATSVRTLVDRQLRPGVDASRAEAELAAARNQLVQARQVLETSRITLGEALGVPAPVERVDPGPLLALPSRPDVPPTDVAGHPALARQAAAVEAAQVREDALGRAYVPRLQLQFAFNGRGSGFGPAGETLDADEGLYPDRPNWVAGLSLSFPAMEYFSIEARRRGEAAAQRSEQARLDQVFLTLKMQDARVRALADAARRTAENMPVLLKAAQEAHTRARARYDTGLGTLTEVAEAQRLLAQAEIDDALARLQVWRALLAAARAAGDLRPFLDLASGGK